MFLVCSGCCSTETVLHIVVKLSWKPMGVCKSLLPQCVQSYSEILLNPKGEEEGFFFYKIFFTSPIFPPNA